MEAGGCFHGADLFPYFVSGWIVLPFLLYDFFQLYGEHRFWPAVWRFVKIYIWMFLQYLLLILLILILIFLYFVIVWYVKF